MRHKLRIDVAILTVLRLNILAPAKDAWRTMHWRISIYGLIISYCPSAYYSGGNGAAVHLV
ncbi:hypothetical protein KDW_54940 [Dictyobacter vulcani]|uniref:Uncharacterized protein n=1 Tax=Dictyobacter vulcani TaxID=2607529 RepID=A0A5J4KW10_9CHLR|nr:hypothetical protein KDW_54940 [Dictyobacter vulcani]